MKAILTIGIPCSGKTTWAIEQRGYFNLNRDDLIMEMFKLSHYSEYKFTKENESIISNKMYDLYKYCATQKMDIILSDTNINDKYRNNTIEFLKNLGYEVELKHFEIDFFDALKRNEKRSKDKYIPLNEMYRMYVAYNKTFGIKLHQNSTLEKCYIFDIDGTLASHIDEDGKNIRNPYEWDKVNLDIPIKPVINILNILQGAGFKIILLSGRDSVCRELTEKWLLDNNIHYNELYMREKGSTVKDRVVKLEFFSELIKKYYVEGVFDDRPSVCQLWKDLGVPLFNVGNSYHIF